MKQNAETGKWEMSLNTETTSERLKAIMQSFVRYDADKKATFSFATSSRPTCEDFTRVAYGISQITWNSNIALLRKGPAKMETERTIKSWKAAARSALMAEQISSRSEAVEWWMLMFSMWETVPNEFVIVHPRLVWDRLYVSCLSPARLTDVNPFQYAVYMSKLSTL
eukprot:6176207-Pleurochrysis_carterae.AAC.2